MEKEKEIGTEATTARSSSRNPPKHHKESVCTCEVPVPIYVNEYDESIINTADEKDDGEKKDDKEYHQEEIDDNSNTDDDADVGY